MAWLCYTISYVWLLGLLFYLYFKAFKLKIPLLNWLPMVSPVPREGWDHECFLRQSLCKNNRLSHAEFFVHLYFSKILRKRNEHKFIINLPSYQHVFLICENRNHYTLNRKSIKRNKLFCSAAANWNRGKQKKVKH